MTDLERKRRRAEEISQRRIERSGTRTMTLRVAKRLRASGLENPKILVNEGIDHGLRSPHRSLRMK